MPKIAIIGGGVAGLTVAHECVEHGCEVLLFEQASIVGGKAATDLYQGMPRDHAVKNISPYYYCLIEQLKRIPTSPGKTVYDDLLARTSVTLFSGEKQLTMNTSLSLFNRLARAYKIFRFFSGLMPKKDLFKFVRLILRYLFSTAKQRKKFDQTTILKLLQFEEDNPLAIIFEGVAVADIHGSALMYLDQFVRQVLTIFNPHKLQYLSNYFVKPASDSFLTPWRAHLQTLGVKFIFEQEVTRLEHDGGKITGIATAEGLIRDFDICVLTTDVPGLKKLDSASQLQLQCLQGPVFDNKACGFYMAISALPANYTAGRLYIDVAHPWAIVAMFYTIDEMTSPAYFPEGCTAYIGFSLGNIKRAGTVTGKTLEQASSAEVQQELLSSLRFSPEDEKTVMAAYWGRTVVAADETNCADAGLNHMATVFSRPVNPQPIPNRTQYYNLLLGGEFTDTLQKAATMEKANEAGKRCSKQILAMFNIDYPDEKFQYKYLPLQARDELI